MNHFFHHITDKLYEYCGFAIGSISSSIVYTDANPTIPYINPLFKILEIASFALLTGALGALGGHLMKILIKKITKNHEAKKETLG